MMQQQVSEKAKHKPNGSFEDSLEPGRHQQRIRPLRSEGQSQYQEEAIGRCKFDPRMCARLDSTQSTMPTLYTTTMASPIASLFLAASEKGLVALEFDFKPAGKGSLRRGLRQSGGEHDKIVWHESPDHMRKYRGELEEYFSGERRKFDFPLDLQGTDFQLACWRALIAIPYGETRTYGDQARAIRKPNAFRAVGMANNRNPIAIVVPCHRVIASNGTLCGYGGGLDVKRKLLELEGALSGSLAA
jgi:methylated-DNA-[protein]-cysteine S-methyltransferase